MITATQQNYRDLLARAVLNERQSREWTQEELASKIEGITTKTISAIESTNYNRELRLATIQKVCNALDIDFRMRFGR